MLVTEEGRKAESSSRFRVTCGSTRTATDIVAENCDVAMEWVKAIQVVCAVWVHHMHVCVAVHISYAVRKLHEFTIMFFPVAGNCFSSN